MLSSDYFCIVPCRMMSFWRPLIVNVRESLSKLNVKFSVDPTLNMDR